MKKLITLTAILFLTTVMFGMKNNYHAINRADFELLNDLRDAGYTVLPEVRVIAYRNPQDTIKHKQTKEYDDLYYMPSKDGKQMKHQKRPDVDAIVDTLVKKNPKIVVNNYYNDDPFFYSNRIGRFYHGGFNYWMYQNPYYFYNDWFYDDFYFGWNYPYFGYNNYWNYPYFGHNDFYFGYNSYWGWNFGWNWYRPYYHNNYWYGQHNNYYGQNNWNGGGNFQSRPQYGRRERPSNFTQTNPTTNRRIAETQPQRNRIGVPQQRNPQNMKQYSESRRTYTPTYENPRMSTRPAYNNTKTMDMNRSRNTGNMDMNNSGNKNMNNSGNRRTETSTQSRTYQQQNYSTPSRSYSPPPNRSSEPQGFGRTINFNSGGDRRSSGSSNFSSGSNNSNSSSGSGSSGGRSSGTSTSTGRR